MEQAEELLVAWVTLLTQFTIVLLFVSLAYKVTAPPLPESSISVLLPLPLYPIPPHH